MHRKQQLSDKYQRYLYFRGLADKGARLSIDKWGRIFTFLPDGIFFLYQNNIFPNYS